MASTPDAHVPVMLDRVVELFLDVPAGVIVDATVGAGGHAAAIARARRDRGASVHVLGIDRDPDALALARDRMAQVDGVAFTPIQARYDELDDVLDEQGVTAIAGVLFDLGISSMHVDQPDRGFSYRHEGPLDMRMGPDAARTAADVVNDYDLDRLTQVIREYGEERFARRIAHAIVEARPLTTTTALADVVKHAIPAATRRTGGHPATRTFQAIRLEVNDELAALESALPRAIARLRPRGVAAVLAYHSLEDRIVKRTFADAASGCICPPGLPVCACGRVPIVEHVIRKPERPGDDEISSNRRASAARLRAVRKLSGGER
ncbi:MAG: 16S rRNA (cytosine(1402)-N(4))-methyltransferase RsmH [Nitriliruptorales bacterium]|nr:16S rRNA (cytosine(1402)-N(4))-methyltransferase RsmH [Nitriliruptorales bacterium]